MEGITGPLTVTWFFGVLLIMVTRS